MTLDDASSARTRATSHFSTDALAGGRDPAIAISAHKARVRIGFPYHAGTGAADPVRAHRECLDKAFADGLSGCLLKFICGAARVLFEDAPLDGMTGVETSFGCFGRVGIPAAVP